MDGTKALDDLCQGVGGLGTAHAPGRLVQQAIDHGFQIWPLLLVAVLWKAARLIEGTTERSYKQFWLDTFAITFVRFLGNTIRFLSFAGGGWWMCHILGIDSILDP